MARTTIDTDVNQFPALTWNHLNINRAHLECGIGAAAAPAPSGLPGGVALALRTPPEVYGRDVPLATGLGASFDAEYDALRAEQGFAVREFTVRAGAAAAPVRLSYAARADVRAADDVVIVAEEGSSSTFIFSYTGTEGEGALGNRVRVFAEKGATVRVVAVNLLGAGFVHFDSLGARAGDGARVEHTVLELGGGRGYLGSFFALAGYRAATENHYGYVADGERSLDVNYVARHTGRESESYMLTDGVVMDGASKVWRGTIDFVKGSAESKGDEQENVLLLSPQVVNKSLPVILCDEEAVEGRHGASIGRLGKDILFYMQSRGVDAAAAQKLMIKAKITSVCRHIPDAALVDEILNYAEGAFAK